MTQLPSPHYRILFATICTELENCAWWLTHKESYIIYRGVDTKDKFVG